MRIHFTQADRLRKAREMAGLTQQQLADIIGIDRASVVSYEKRGTRKDYILRYWAEITRVASEDLQPEQRPSDYKATPSQTHNRRNTRPINRSDTRRPN